MLKALHTQRPREALPMAVSGTALPLSANSPSLASDVRSPRPGLSLLQPSSTVMLTQRVRAILFLEGLRRRSWDLQGSRVIPPLGQTQHAHHSRLSRLPSLVFVKTPDVKLCLWSSSLQPTAARRPSAECCYECMPASTGAWTSLATRFDCFPPWSHWLNTRAE